MKTTLLFVLTLSGLSALSTHIFRKYHYVGKLRTWAGAQRYCRENFNDLATVDDQEDNDRVMSVRKGHVGYVWIGLYDDMKGWKWALGNKDLNNGFSNWNENEPNNLRSREGCAMMRRDGSWWDLDCAQQHPAVCYNERGPSRYILVKTRRRWHMAKRHCRSHYTDLVSVRNMSENNAISSLLSQATWIGLHRKRWGQWSDNTPRTFTIWHNGQPDNNGASCTEIDTATGMWWDADCQAKHHFICQTVSHPVPQHKTTLKLKFRSEADLSDPAVQQQMLEQLHAKLEQHGLSDFKLRWIQTNGQTFHKEDKEKKDKGSCG